MLDYRRICRQCNRSQNLYEQIWVLLTIERILLLRLFLLESRTMS